MRALVEKGNHHFPWDPVLFDRYVGWLPGTSRLGMKFVVVDATIEDIGGDPIAHFEAKVVGNLWPISSQIHLEEVLLVPESNLYFGTARFLKLGR